MITRAFNSAEECHLHTVEAEGSIPSTPTENLLTLAQGFGSTATTMGVETSRIDGILR